MCSNIPKFSFVTFHSSIHISDCHKHSYSHPQNPPLTLLYLPKKKPRKKERNRLLHQDIVYETKLLTFVYIINKPIFCLSDEPSISMLVDRKSKE